MEGSANHGHRRDGLQPSLIVLHYTAMADGASARARLCDPSAEVSAHWLIHEDGTPDALVPEDRRAWHAGAGGWRGQDDINSRSIGIELANPGDRPFGAAQMNTLEQLLARIMQQWSIGPEGVIGHSDMAPGRKSDPGPRFDWARLARSGLALHPVRLQTESTSNLPPFADSLDRIGYPAADAQARLDAFRLRFSPSRTGPETFSDRALAAQIAELFEY